MDTQNEATPDEASAARHAAEQEAEAAHERLRDAEGRHRQAICALTEIEDRAKSGERVRSDALVKARAAIEVAELALPKARSDAEAADDAVRAARWDAELADARAEMSSYGSEADEAIEAAADALALALSLAAQEGAARDRVVNAMSARHRKALGLAGFSLDRGFGRRYVDRALASVLASVSGEAARSVYRQNSLERGLLVGMAGGVRDLAHKWESRRAEADGVERLVAARVAGARKDQR